MPKPDPAIRQIHERCVLDDSTMEEFDAWLRLHDMSWQGLDRGDYNGITLEQAQLRFIGEDPVHWCRAFMTEPDTGEPYTFWEYQQESVRAWDQDVIHQDGAEVGKTREIVALIVWGQSTGFGYTIQNPQILVGAPQQTHLNEIIMAVEAHFGESDGSEGVKPLIHRFWRKPTKSPHYLMKFKGPTCTQNQLGLVYFRPAGFDGEAFRGVHVRGLGLFDEAAKIKNKVCWSEFWRALKPGSYSRVYSVPDGDNTTQFYQMSQDAVPNLPKGSPGRRLFHWPKTLMPEPFWSKERKQKFVRDFNGEDSPGYQRNVLGLHGQQENPVWPWELIESNIQNVPDYRCIRLRADKQRDELNVTVERVTLTRDETGRKHHETHVLADYTDSLSPYQSGDTCRAAVRKLLREHLDPETAGLFWGGADFGYSNDPTEIFLSQELGHELRDRVRINAKGIDYAMQAELIHCLDELFNFTPNWGVDFGNAGTAVVHMLQNQEQFAEGDYSNRLTGFDFARVLDCMDEEGSVLEEADDKGEPRAVRKPGKELATDLMTRRMQHQGYGWPYDPEVIAHLSNHTAREGSRHRIFDKKNDHTIDAKRAQILRKTFNEEAGGVDVFSCGAYRRAS